MVKNKKKTKNLELDIHVPKRGNSEFFHGKQEIPQQMANSAVRRENLHATEYCWH